MSAQALSHCTRRLARPLYITISTSAINAKIITKMIRPANTMGILQEVKRKRRNAARIKPLWSQVNGGAKKEGEGDGPNLKRMTHKRKAALTARMPLRCYSFVSGDSGIFGSRRWAASNSALAAL